MGGLLWAVKSSAILVTGQQPPVIFEGAAVVFCVAAAGLALAVPAGPRRQLLLVISVAGFATSVVALVGGEALEFALLPATLTVLVVLVAAGGALRSGRVVARLIGLGTIPLIAAGGLLSTADERLLEVPLLVLSFLWMVLGWRIMRDPAGGLGLPVRVPR